MNSEQTWLEGIISIEAVLQSGSREIGGIFVRRTAKRARDRKWRWLERTAVAAGVPVTDVDEAFIEERASGSSHGGVIAVVGPRRFVSLGDLVIGKERPFIVMIDGVEDPFNFGQAVRSLYAAGVDGLVLRPRNWLSAAGVVVRSSAGASEWIATAVAETAESAAEFFRAHGLIVACTSEQTAQSIYQADLTQPLFLLIGGERRGITRSFMEQADLHLQIPYARSDYQQSLGVAASAAILGFEVMRQRLAG